MYLAIEEGTKRRIFPMTGYSFEYERNERVNVINVNTGQFYSFFIDNVKIYQLDNEEEAIEWLEIGTEKLNKIYHEKYKFDSDHKTKIKELFTEKK